MGPARENQILPDRDKCGAQKRAVHGLPFRLCGATFDSSGPIYALASTHNFVICLTCSRALSTCRGYLGGGRRRTRSRRTSRSRSRSRRSTGRRRGRSRSRGLIMVDDHGVPSRFLLALVLLLTQIPHALVDDSLRLSQKSRSGACMYVWAWYKLLFNVIVYSIYLRLR